MNQSKIDHVEENKLSNDSLEAKKTLSIVHGRICSLGFPPAKTQNRVLIESDKGSYKFTSSGLKLKNELIVGP